MPFVEPTIRPLFAGAAATPEPEKPNFFTETIPAAFRTENMIGSLFSRESGVPALIQAPQGDFNPFEHIEGYEDRARSFTNANTLNEVEALKRQIDRERNDRETLAASGIGGFVAAIGAGVVDPTVFIPVGGALKKGESLLRVTARTAAAAGLSTAVQEVGLNATQEERTLAESGLNIAGATVLGGVLGAGFGALSKAQQARLAKQFEQDMRAPVGDIDAADPFASAPAKVSGGGLSADVVSRETLGDVVGVAKPLLDVARTIDPTLSLATARSQNVRSLGAALAESPLLREANIVKTQKVEIAPGVFEDRHVFRETPQAVESAIRRKSERRMGEGIQILDDAYQGYVFGSHKRTITPKLRAGLSALTQTGDGAGKLRPREFEREVWKALARGDKSDIPEVAQAAQAIRERVLKPLEDEAVELGMFGFDRIPPEVEGGAEKLVPRRPSAGQTAESYRPRLYDHAKIKARRPEFEDKLFNFYRRERDAAKARASDLDTQINDVLFRRIEGIREDVLNTVRRQRRLLNKAESAERSAEKRASAVKGAAREKTTQSSAATERSQSLVGDVKDLTDEEFAYYRGLSRDLQRGHGAERPERFAQFVRRNGGLSLEEVQNQFSDALNGRNISRKDGVQLFYMREAAEQEGYLPEGSTVNDFIDLLNEDLAGRPVVNPRDEGIAAYDEYIADLATEAEKAGIDLADPHQLASYMTGENFAKISEKKSARIKEAALRERYTLRRLSGATETLQDVEVQLHEARGYARTLRDLSSDLDDNLKAYGDALRKARLERDRLRRRYLKADRKSEVDDAFLKENAVRTVDRILSTPVGRLTYDAEEASSGLGPKKGGSLSGRFHARRLLLPDSEIEEFLDDDLNYMLRNVSRSMTADIELMRTFGSVDLDAQFKGIADEYAQMARDVDPKAPDAEQQRKAIADEQAQVIRNVAGIRDRLRGTYALPEDPSQIGYRVINGFKALNHLRLMGGVTLSSIPDTARVVFSNGMGNFAGVAMERLVTAVKRTKIPAGKELEFAGTAFELVNDSRTAALSDILDNYGRGSKFERALGAAQSNFGQLSLMAPWNHAMKSAAGLTTQNRILSAARALAEGKAKKNDLQFVARLGIGESDLRKMAKAFNEFGEDNGRVLWANTEAWTDRRLADMFHNAMRAETDRIIVQPGQEKPLWASGPIGSLIFQFQSYNFAATQRVVLAGVQGLSQRDMTVVSTIVGQVALGMLVAKLKMEQAGRGEETAAWSGRRWIAEGVDRSGMLGALTYVNLASERLTGGRIGLSALAGKEPLSRYNSRNALGTFLGPTAGLAQDAFTVSAATARALADGEPVTDGDIAALRRLLPYQNLFYVRQLFDQMETALGSDKFTDAEP